MKKLLVTLAFVSALIVGVIGIPNYASGTNDPNIIVLRKSNTLVLHSAVTGDSIAAIQMKAFAMSANLGSKGVIYLVLDTPGGEVDAGNDLIDSLKGLRTPVKTITLFAASMGFHIAQSLGERLITPSGTLMSHRVSVSGLAGQVPGSAISQLMLIFKQSIMMDTIISERMGMPIIDYQDLIRDEYWVTGKDAVDQKAADRVIHVRCGSDMLGASLETLKTQFGPASITYSDCPLVRAPLKVELGGLSGTAPEKEKLTEFLRELMYDKSSFVGDYITNNKYLNFLKK